MTQKLFAVRAIFYQRQSGSLKGIPAWDKEVVNQQLESSALNVPITTKLSVQDYRALLDRANIQGLNQTSLVRLAVRNYLSTPINPKTPSKAA